MMRTAIVLLAVVLALVCVTYLYAHHVWDPLPTGSKIDRFDIEKSARKLSLFVNGKSLKSYRVALGRNLIGSNQKEGYYKTLKKIYRIDCRTPTKHIQLERA